MNKTRHLIFIIVALLAAVSMAGRRERVPDKSAAAKSRYYYYEGLRQDLAGNADAAYECFRRALQLDPSNHEAAYMTGVRRQQLRNPALNDSLEFVASMELMRQYVDAYPDDIDEGLFYGYMAANSDTAGEAIRVLDRLAERYPDRSNVLLYLSDAYQKKGDSKQAIEVMDRYERIEGKSAPLTLHKMTMYMENGDSVGALREVDRLIKSDTAEYSYLILKGNLYEVMNKQDSALQLYLRAERMAPELSAPKLALMETYREMGDSTAYDAKVYEVLITEDLDATQKTALLSQYLQRIIDDKSDTGRGDYLFSVLRAQNPRDPDVLNLAARYSAAKGNYDDAAEQIGYALDMDPDNLELYRQKIFYLANADRVDEALKVYDESAAFVTMPAEMQLYKGLLLHNEKRYDEALALYGRLVHSIDSTLDTSRDISLSKDIRRDITMEELNMLSSVLTSMGDTSYQKGDTTAAYRDYRNALELNSDNTMAANNYAYFLATRGGDLEKARSLSEKSLRGQDADNPTFLDTYAWIQYLLGDCKAALETQKKVIDLMEKAGRPDAEALDHYGDMLMKEGSVSDAVDAWERALEAEPDDPGAIKDKIEKAEKEK